MLDVLPRPRGWEYRPAYMTELRPSSSQAECGIRWRQDNAVSGQNQRLSSNLEPWRVPRSMYCEGGSRPQMGKEHIPRCCAACENDIAKRHF